MSHSLSTNETPDSPSSHSALGHPLLWVVLAMTMLVGISLFRGTPRTVKREKLSAAESTKPASPAVREKDILQTLMNETVNLDFEGVPLEAAITDVGKQLGIPVWFDRQTLADSAVSMEQPVTIQLRGITGRSALHLILSPVSLAWVIEDEVLKITSVLCWDALFTRIYEVTDLVAIGDPKGGERFDPTSLQQVIETCIFADSWENLSGRGSVMAIGNGTSATLAIRQSQAVHEGIARLLADLRKARRIPGDAARPVCAAADQSPAALREAAIRKALDKMVSVNAEQRPLQTVVSDVARQIGVPLFLDRDGFAEEGVAIDSPITFKYSGISARSALNLILRQVHVAWIIRNEVLFLTSGLKVEEQVEVHVYDMTEIAPKLRSTIGVVSYDLTTISNAIHTTIQPDSDWGNGPGVIMPYRNGGVVALVIPQTQAVHSEVSDFLEELRAITRSRSAPSADQPLENTKPSVPTTELSTVEQRETAILKALDKTVDVDYQDRPLEEVIAGLGRQLDVPVRIDRQTLTDEGVALDWPVTIRFPGITGRSALELVLSPVQLDWIVHHEVLNITTNTKASEFLETRVYDVTDLVALRDQAGAAGADFAGLLDLLTTTISPETWEDLSGPGSAQAFSSGGIDAIVVRQTLRIHDEIVAFFAKLQSQRRPGVTTIRTELPAQDRQSRPNRAASTSDRFSNPRLDALVQGNNQFTLELYARLVRGRADNAFVSPYGISSALAMIYYGAEGETAREIADAMRFRLRPKDLATAVGDMQFKSFVPHDGVLGTANRVWGRQGLAFLDSYRETLHFRFDCGFEQIEFADSAKAAKSVNSWTSGATKGLVSDVITNRDLDDQTQFVVTSVAYFSGKWTVPFHHESTLVEDFSTGSGDVKVPMMRLHHETCLYAAIDGLQILDKTYGDGEFSMVILLPDQVPGSLAKLESSLTSDNLARWLGALSPENIQIAVPRFNLETGYDLSDVLKSLGMKRAFEPAAADFSGMCDTQEIALGKILHKSYGAVDELGTQAAGATRAFGYLREVPRKPQLFRADRPFVFLIRDNRTGAILFIGRVVNPKEAQSRG
jgi:serpin B